YSEPFLTYKNKVVDPIGNNSAAPNNLFVEWKDDPYNKLPASVYKEIAPMRDDTVCKIEFLESYEVAPGYWKQEPQYGTITNCTPLPTGGQKCNSYSGIVGYQSVWEPAIYGKRLASACVHNAQVDAYCQGRECVTTCGTTAKGGQYYWLTSAWGGCSNGCGTGTQTRTVVCKAKNGVTVSDTYCSSAGSKPTTSQPCQGVTSCGYSWSVGGWSACSNNCSGGYQTRDIYCRRSDGSAVPDSYCGGKPAAIQQCSNPSAPECIRYGKWRLVGTESSSKTWLGYGTCGSNWHASHYCNYDSSRYNPRVKDGDVCVLNGGVGYEISAFTKNEASGTSIPVQCVGICVVNRLACM
ncbi:TPA: thrombospondin type-1 domain-containing protein, partial [Aeromonas veronii]